LRPFNVTNIISVSSKCIKTVCGWGFAPDSTGIFYSTPSDFLASFVNEDHFAAGELRERGTAMDGCAQAPILYMALITVYYAYDSK